MNAALFSDFSNGGFTPSEPISPVREAPSLSLIATSKSTFSEDLKGALKSGSRSKNHAAQILTLCAEIQNDINLLTKNQIASILKVSEKCRSKRTVLELLRLQDEPPPLEEIGSTRTRVEGTLQNSSRSKNYRKKIEKLCLRLPEDLKDFTPSDIVSVLLLATKCHCVESVSLIFGYVAEKKTPKQKRVLLTPDQRKENRRKSKRACEKRKIANDPAYKVLNRLRKRLACVLKGKKKAKRIHLLLGCSTSYLKLHIESQWQPGMCWDNYGIDGWHVDHIRPCASFDLANPEEQAACFHYTNLQPLWAIENIRKGARYEHPRPVKSVYPVAPLDW